MSVVTGSPTSQWPASVTNPNATNSISWPQPVVAATPSGITPPVTFPTRPADQLPAQLTVANEDGVENPALPLTALAPAPNTSPVATRTEVNYFGPETEEEEESDDEG